MEDKLIAPHESFQIQELLNFKTVCGVKSNELSKLAQDADLKRLIDSDINQTMQQLQELKGLLMTAEMKQFNTAQAVANPNYQNP